jgi:putative hydroxymethylpyrimidine transport system substrate-binding protein
VPGTRTRHLPPSALLALGLALALGLSGCGAVAARGSAHLAQISVALDFTPNPAHAPLYLAQADGYARREGVALQIRQPGSGPDSLKLLLGGRVDIGVLDIDDLALAEEHGAAIVAVAALVQQPLAALIAQPDISDPRQLVGRRIGVSGLPSDPAFLRAVLGRVGVHLDQVHLVTIGFNAVAQMVAGNIAAVPAFWSDEGVALRQRGLEVHEFRIDRYGAPEYPEVVLAVRRAELSTRRGALVHALAAIALGARRARSDPAQAARVIAAAAGSGDLKLIRAQTQALTPALEPPLTLNRTILQRYAAFDARTSLLPARLDVARAFDFTLAPAALRLAGMR